MKTIRIAIVTIRNLGQSPCPRCLVKKDDIHHLGKPKDMNTRTENARTDSDARRKTIDDARFAIYEQHCAVDSKRVDDLLKEDSLLPTKVCSVDDDIRPLNFASRTRSLCSNGLDSMSSSWCLSTRCMSAKEHSSHSFFIYFVYWKP